MTCGEDLSIYLDQAGKRLECWIIEFKLYLVFSSNFGQMIKLSANISVVDPDPVGSALFGRIRKRIVTEKTDPERFRVV